MNDLHPRHSRPEFAHPSVPARAGLAFAAFLISGALIGGLLGLFEKQSSDAALARAAAPAVAHPAFERAASDSLLASKSTP
jgi:hypothetical protein